MASVISPDDLPAQMLGEKLRREFLERPVLTSVEFSFRLIDCRPSFFVEFFRRWVQHEPRQAGFDHLSRRAELSGPHQLIDELFQLRLCQLELHQRILIQSRPHAISFHPRYNSPLTKPRASVS